MTIPDRKASPCRGAVYRYKRLKYSLLLLLLAGFSLLGVAGLVVVPGIAMKALGLCLALATGLILWIQVSYLFLPRDLVTIDENGIWDRRVSVAPVPWHAIKRAYRKSSIPIASIEHVYLELADSRYRQRPRLAGIEYLAGSQLRNGRRYLINPACLTGSAAEILAAIGAFRPDIVTLPPDPLGPEASVDPSEAADYDHDAERFVVVRERKQVAITLALCLAFMALFAILVFSGYRRVIIPALFLGGATLAALWLLRELSNSKPILTVDRNGITLREFGSRTVPWHQVRDVKVSDWFIAVEELEASGVPTPGPIAALFSSRDPVIVSFAMSASVDETRAAVAHFRTQALNSSSRR